jgi:hypothetical protein
MRGSRQPQIVVFLVLLAFAWVVGQSLIDLTQRAAKMEARLGEEARVATSTPPSSASSPALASVAELDGRLYHILVGSYSSERADGRSLWSIAFSTDD